MERAVSGCSFAPACPSLLPRIARCGCLLFFSRPAAGRPRSPSRQRKMRHPSVFYGSRSHVVFRLFPPLFPASRRKKGRAKVGAPHKIDKADTMKWFQQKVRLDGRRPWGLLRHTKESKAHLAPLPSGLFFVSNSRHPPPPSPPLPDAVRRCVEHRQAQEPLSEPPQQEAQEEVIGLMGDVVCGSGTRRVSPCVAPTAWHLAACRPPRALVCDPRAAGGAFILL